jgi:putative transposase
MFTVLVSLVGAALSFFKTQQNLAVENLALRHQIGILKRTLGKGRVRFKPFDRGLWVMLFRLWSGWQEALAIVQPATVIRWHREGFRRFWTRKSRRRDGRPALDREMRALIRKMSIANLTWGAPRICNELAKIGIKVSRSTVAKYMVRHRKLLSPNWRAFLDNHVTSLVSLDFFVVPTATFRVLLVLLIRGHDRRRILHFNVTSSPSAAWTAQQVVQTFPEETAPRYLL